MRHVEYVTQCDEESKSIIAGNASDDARRLYPSITESIMALASKDSNRGRGIERRDK